MSFNWAYCREVAQQLYDEAKKLQETNSELREAKFRAAISRAYYAAYQTAKDFLIAKNYYYPSNDESRSDHAYVIQTFNKLQDVKKDRIRTDLYTLRQARVSADYESVFDSDIASSLESAAEAALSYSLRVIENIKKLQKQK
jgi:uncharacterized protein (UPF0332 family)